MRRAISKNNQPPNAMPTGHRTNESTLLDIGTLLCFDPNGLPMNAGGAFSPRRFPSGQSGVPTPGGDYPADLGHIAST